VTRVNPDRSVDVVYQDGEAATKLHPSTVRRLREGTINCFCGDSFRGSSYFPCFTLPHSRPQGSVFRGRACGSQEPARRQMGSSKGPS
jgi:hypothetical protein